MLNPAEHRRVDDAIRAAQARTSGEIVCILTQEVSAYREVPLAVAIACALLGPLVAVALGLRPWMVWPGSQDWVAAQANPAGAAVIQTMEGYGVLQVIVFAVVALGVAWPPVRRVLTPSTLKHHRVHRAALQQFLATGLHANPRRTGVVIFASRKDRRVELLADDAIHAAVGDTAWNGAVKAVQDGMRRNDPAAGFVAAVGICGAALATHFPAESGGNDPRGDHMVEV